MSSDVFDSDDDSHIFEKDWSKVMDSRYKDGLRDGLHEGKDNSLQNGFDLSYSQGFHVNYSCSKLRGILLALLLQYQELESGTRKKMENLITSISEKEKELGRAETQTVSNDAANEDPKSVARNQESSHKNIRTDHAAVINSFKQECENILKEVKWSDEDIKKLLP